jgi:hypothetical protein
MAFDDTSNGMVFGTHFFFDPVAGTDTRSLAFARINQIDLSVVWFYYFPINTVTIDPDIQPFVVNIKGKVYAT